MVRRMSAGLAAVAVLTGCSGGDADRPESPSATTATVTEATESATEAAATPPEDACYDYSVAPPRRSDGRAPVPCTEEHTTRTMTVIDVPSQLQDEILGAGGEHPWITQQCDAAMEEFLGGSLERQKMYLWWAHGILPSPGDVEDGATWLRCDVMSPRGSTLTPLPADTPYVTDAEIPQEYARCRDDDTRRWVSCAEPHDYRVAEVVRLEEFLDNGDVEDQMRMLGLCRGDDDALRAFIAISQERWDQGERALFCLEETDPDAERITIGPDDS